MQALKNAIKAHENAPIIEQLKRDKAEYLARKNIELRSILKERLKEIKNDFSEELSEKNVNDINAYAKDVITRLKESRTLPRFFNLYNNYIASKIADFVKKADPNPISRGRLGMSTRTNESHSSYITRTGLTRTNKNNNNNNNNSNNNNNNNSRKGGARRTRKHRGRKMRKTRHTRR